MTWLFSLIFAVFGFGASTNAPIAPQSAPAPIPISTPTLASTPAPTAVPTSTPSFHEEPTPSAAAPSSCVSIPDYPGLCEWHEQIVAAGQVPLTLPTVNDPACPTLDVFIISGQRVCGRDGYPSDWSGATPSPTP